MIHCSVVVLNANITDPTVTVRNMWHTGQGCVVPMAQGESADRTCGSGRERSRKYHLSLDGSSTASLNMTLRPLQPTYAGNTFDSQSVQ